MKKAPIISIVVLFGLILAACSGPTGSAPASNPPAANPAGVSTVAPEKIAPPAANRMQFNDQAAVRVEVTPLNLNDPSAATLDFQITMDTHSVDLNYDLTKIATLNSDAGEEVKPVKWDGPGGGGHHVSGVLSFPPSRERGPSVTLVLRGIADVPERTFVWDATD